MGSEKINQRLTELEVLRKQTRIWRLSITAVFALLTIISIIVMTVSVRGITADGPQKDEFTQALNTEMQATVLPTVEDVGRDAINRIDFRNEISKLNARTPELADASLTQLRQLAKNIPEHGQDILTKQVDSTLKAHEAKIKALYPTATDDQIASLMTDVTQETNDQMGVVADDLFRPHVETLNNIVSDLSKIQKDEAGKVKGEVPTWQMAFLVADIARDDFKSFEPTKTTAKNAKGAKK